MKLKTLFICGLLFTSGIVNAQTDFRPGFIIENSGDTIFGEIDYRGDLLMSSRCRFKDKNDIVTTYSPTDIAAYRFIDSKFFVSKEVDRKFVFLEYLIKGNVDIYYMRDEMGDHYYINKDEIGLTEIPFKEGTKYVDGVRYFYESKTHVGLLNYYMQDAPKFTSRINSIKRPEHRSLIKLAEDYHNSVCEGEKCIIYEKSVPFLKIVPEIITGIINYTTDEDLINSSLIDNYYFQTGIIAHVWMPRASEKMYLRTGVLFSRLSLEDEQKSIYKIPIQVEYIYPRGFFRPRVAYGLNYYIPSYRSISLDFGGNIRLSETLFISVTSDIEFHSKFFMPSDLISHSFKLGLFIGFN